MAATLQVVVRSVASEANLTIAVVVGGKARTMRRSQAEPVAAVLRRLELQAAGGQRPYCPVHGASPDVREAPGEGPPTTVVRLLDPDGRSVDGESLNAAAWQDGGTLVVGAERHVITLNPPAVVSMAVGPLPLVDYEMVPALTIEFADPACCEWAWHRLPADPDPVPRGKAQAAAPPPTGPPIAITATYTPTAADVGYRLRVVCIPRDRKGREGVPHTVVLPHPVSPGPPTPPFLGRIPGPPTAGYRILTYNTLADAYCDTDFARTNLYLFCHRRFLDIHYRKQLLAREVRCYVPDIVCLQEVERRLFDDHWVPQLARDGLEGQFCSKEGKQPIGLALFHRSAKFTATAAHRVNLTTVWKDYPEVAALCAASPPIRRALEVSTTVAQALVLRPIPADGGAGAGAGAERRPLCVVNTHLYSHPQAPHIRLLQAYLVAREVERLVGSDCAVILFNASPGEGLHELLTSGTTPNTAEDWRRGATWRPLETKEEREAAWFSPKADTDLPIPADYPRLPLATNRSFLSACPNVDATFVNPTLAIAVDYLFVAPDCVRVLRSYPGFPIDVLRQGTAIPSEVFGSDHVSLVADFDWD